MIWQQQHGEVHPKTTSVNTQNETKGLWGNSLSVHEGGASLSKGGSKHHLSETAQQQMFGSSKGYTVTHVYESPVLSFHESCIGLTDRVRMPNTNAKDLSCHASWIIYKEGCKTEA